MAFTKEAAEELGSLHGEPEWLRAERRRAFELYEELDLPSASDEEWRRTDLRGLDLNGFEPREEARGKPAAETISDVSAVIRQSGSEPGVVQMEPGLAERGVIFIPLSQAAREHPDLVRTHLFKQVMPERDKFSALHAALFSGGSFLYVPPGLRIERPIVSQYWSGAGGAAVLPHTLILAGEGSSFNYVDELLSPELERAALTSGSAEVYLDRGAQVGYVSLQRWGRHAWQFANTIARLGEESRFQFIGVGLGGRFSRQRVEARLEGAGSVAELKALFFGSGEQFFDYHTLQQHQVGQTTSDLLFKGALKDTARSVYAGLIRIEKGATRSNAYQANRNLLLSDAAKAQSIPMLEILNNDVRCTNGATVAPVDPNQLFYLQSRGIPVPVAERMVVRGFFAEVLERIPVAQARELVETELEARLG